MAANGEDKGKGNSDTVDMVVDGRAVGFIYDSAKQTTAKERSRSPRQRDPDAEMAWKPKWVKSSESPRQTTAKGRLHSPHQRDTDMIQKQKWANSSVSGAGAGGNLFLVDDLLRYPSKSIPCTSAEEKAQPHQCTRRKQVDDASPLSVMEDAAETHSFSPYYDVEKDIELQQALHKLATIINKKLGSFGPLRVVEDATETRSCIPDYVIEKEAQLQQGLQESGMQTAAIKRSHSPCQGDADMAQKQKWVKSTVSGSGGGGDMFSVNNLLGYASDNAPCTLAEEEAQLHQALYESQRTGRKQIDDAGPSRVVEDAAKTHSCLPCYVVEKEAQLQQESARQTKAKERLHSTCQRHADTSQKHKWVKSTVSGTGAGGNVFLVDDLLGHAPHGIPGTTAEKKAQLHQALYQSPRTTGKRVDDAGPLIVADEADETHSCSPCRLFELEAELQQALHKLARTINEELGSFGPSRAVEDAADDVHAMTECMHRVQGNQNIDDPFMLRVSTQLSTQVHEGAQNIDDPYILWLSTQRGALPPTRPTTSQAPELP